MNDENAITYSLVQCESGNCKKTNGYVKNSNGIYAFVKDIGEKVTFVDGVGSKYGLASGTTKDSCDFNNVATYNVGKITGNKNMCIGQSEVVEFLNGQYVILKDKPAVMDTPFEDSTISIPIKSSGNYIIRDQFYNKGNCL